MGDWKRVRIAIIGVGAAMLVALGVTPASAHYVYDDGDVYESSGFDQCVYMYSESSHGESGNGYEKGKVAAVKSYEEETSSGSTKINCDDNYGDPSAEWTRPSQNLQLREEYFRLNSNPTHNKRFPDDWSLCEYTDWFYNGKDASELTVTGEMRGPSICGDSYYGTLTTGNVNNESAEHHD